MASEPPPPPKQPVTLKNLQGITLVNSVQEAFTGDEPTEIPNGSANSNAAIEEYNIDGAFGITLINSTMRSYTTGSGETIMLRTNLNDSTNEASNEGAAEPGPSQERNADSSPTPEKNQDTTRKRTTGGPRTVMTDFTSTVPLPYQSARPTEGQASSMQNPNGGATNSPSDANNLGQASSNQAFNRSASTSPSDESSLFQPYSSSRKFLTELIRVLWRGAWTWLSLGWLKKWFG